MSENDEQPPEQMRTVCSTCHGDGHIHVPSAAMLCGEPQTILSAKLCPHCPDGQGWRAGLEPPT